MKKVLMILSIMSAVYCYGRTHNINQKEWSCKEKISVIAQLKSNEYSATEPINLEITIVNDSKLNIFIILTNPLKQFKIEIKDKWNNKILPLTLLGQQLQNQEFLRRIVKKIESKDRYVFNLDIKEYFYLSLKSSYSLSVEGMYLDDSKKFIKFKIDDITFSIK